VCGIPKVGGGLVGPHRPGWCGLALGRQANWLHLYVDDRIGGATPGPSPHTVTLIL